MAPPVVAHILRSASKAKMIRSGRCSARSWKLASPGDASPLVSAVTVALPPCFDQGRQETTTENWTRPRRDARITNVARASQHGRLHGQVALGEAGRAQRVQ